MDRKRKTPKLNEMESNELKFVMNTLRDLLKDSALSKQRKLFEDMQKSIEKANEKERRINARCSKLHSEIASNMSKIKAAIQLSEEDKNTIDTLNEELEKAWKIADDLRMERCKNEADRFSESSRRSKRDTLFSSNVSLQRQRQDFYEAEKTWISEKKSLQNEVEIQRKMSENLKVEVKELLQRIESMNSILNKKNEEIKQLEANVKVVEEISVHKELGKGDQSAILDEIEKSRLQIFELEEELTNKERMIEELTKENKVKTAELELLGKEIEAKSKDCFLIESNVVKKYPSEGERKNHKNLDKQISELCTKENEMALRLKFLEFSLYEKTNLLSKIQNDNYMLKTELNGEKELRHELSEKCNALREEVNKNTKLLKELENARNRYVFVIGKLETKNCNLEKELASIEHYKYSEKIIILENDLQAARKELKEKENCLKETKEEISEIKSETDTISKHLVDCLKIIESVHASCDTFIETKSKFCNDKQSSPKGDTHLLILDLKQRMKDLVELYKELMVEKYKLYDEIEFLKNQSYSQKEKESKWTETEHIYFEKEQNNNEETESLSGNLMLNFNTAVQEIDLEFKETNIDQEKQNEETGFPPYETYFSFIKPEKISSNYEIHSFHSGQENKSSKVDLNNSSITINDESRSYLTVASLSTSTEESLEENFIFREAGDTNSSQKIIKTNAVIPDVVTSQDLVKYRQQMRLKQKKLDILKKELDSTSSNFSTNSAIYQKDNQKRIMNAMSVKKLQLGKNRRK